MPASLRKTRKPCKSVRNGESAIDNTLKPDRRHRSLLIYVMCLRFHDVGTLKRDNTA